MKVFLLVVALAVIPACGQGNDIAALQHEAVTLTKYYRPKLESLDKQAEAAAKEGNALELEKIVDESEEALATGVTVVNDDLDAGESWLAQYDRGMLATAAPAPAQPTESAAPTEAPAAPTEPVNTPQTGQPPAAQEAAPQH